MNSTSTSEENGSRGNNDNTSDKVAITALVISVAAFLITFLQVFQQYLASAEGYRRCAKSVMGLWNSGTHRRFSWKEFRFEVTFEAPIIFTAEPENKKGPVYKRKPDGSIEYDPVYIVTGEPKSYRETQTKEPGDRTISNVHTADDERASWITFLGAIQEQERVSRLWDRAPTQEMPNDSSQPVSWWLGTSLKVVKSTFAALRKKNQVQDKEAGESDGEMIPGQSQTVYTICYMMQKKNRSWDFMPANVLKPFATTTICHIVEMMAMLGVFWKEFSVDKTILRAEGNGFILTSTWVHGLGILSTFSRLGTQDFGKNRVIPCIELKDLSFGIVPSILDRKLKPDKKFLPQDKRLEVGDDNLERTMRMLGAKYGWEDFRQRRERPLIFAITYEIIAMLARSFHIPKSRFRMLPVPCADAWTSLLDPVACLKAFCNNFQEEFKRNHESQVLQDPSSHLHTLITLISKSFSNQINHISSDMLARKLELRSYEELPHSDPSTAQRTSREKSERDASNDRFESYKTSHDSDYEILETVHNHLTTIDDLIAKHTIEFRPIICEVLSSHISQLLLQHEELNATLVESDGREAALVNFYFSKIMPLAAPLPEIKPERVIIPGEGTVDSLVSKAEAGTASIRLGPSGMKGRVTEDTAADVVDADRKQTELDHQRSRRIIWLALNFRMWCWFVLHDFDPRDKLVVPGALWGSRMPVFIG